MAGGQMFEPKEAVPVAGSASTGIMLNHLKSMQTSVQVPKPTITLTKTTGQIHKAKS